MSSLRGLSLFEEMMPLIKKTQAPVQHQQVKVTDMAQALYEMGFEFDVNEDQMGQGQQVLDLLFHRDGVQGQQTHCLGVRRTASGSGTNWTPRLFEFIQQVENKPMGGMIRLLSHFARGVRLGATGINPAFVLYRNVVRDALERTIMSQSGKAHTRGHVSGGVVRSWAGPRPGRSW